MPLPHSLPELQRVGDRAYQAEGMQDWPFLLTLAEPCYRGVKIAVAFPLTFVCFTLLYTCFL